MKYCPKLRNKVLPNRAVAVMTMSLFLVTHIRQSSGVEVVGAPKPSMITTPLPFA
jgi:hypothetical protein